MFEKCARMFHASMREEKRFGWKSERLIPCMIYDFNSNEALEAKLRRDYEKYFNPLPSPLVRGRMKKVFARNSDDAIYSESSLDYSNSQIYSAIHADPCLYRGFTSGLTNIRARELNLRLRHSISDAKRLI